MSDDLGLEISALCADFDWVRGFTDPEFNKINIPRIKKCVDLAVDLDTRVVTMHIGRLPDDSGASRLTRRRCARRRCWPSMPRRGA